MGQSCSQDHWLGYHQQTGVFQVFEHSSIRRLEEAKERRRSWNVFPKRARKSSHAREYNIGLQSTLSVTLIEKLDSEQDVSSHSKTSMLKLNQVAHRKP